MSRRISRLSGLLAAAGLADRDIERERIRADRDARNFATGTQALQSLVPAAFQGLDVYRGDVKAEADTAAAQAVADAASPDPEVAKSALAKFDQQGEGASWFKKNLGGSDNATKAARAFATGEIGKQTQARTDKKTADDLLREGFGLKKAGLDQAKALDDAKAAREEEKAIGDRIARGADAAANREHQEKFKRMEIEARKNRGGGKSAEDIEAQRLRVELLRAQVAAAQAKAGGDGTSKPKVKEAEEVTEVDTALDEAKRVAAEKDEIDTGSLSNLRNFIAQKISVSDPKVTAFKASIGDQLAEYIKNISGATVSEPEREQLLQNVPTMNDGDDEFVAKLNRIIKKLEEKKKAKVRALDIAGRDVSAFDQGDDANPADAFFGGG